MSSKNFFSMLFKVWIVCKEFIHFEENCCTTLYSFWKTFYFNLLKPKVEDTVAKVFNQKIQTFKGGYLDFSHLTELKNVHINEIYMKKNTNHQ